MFLQLILSGVALAGSIYYRVSMDSRANKPHMMKWNKLMAGTGIKNKNDETFTPFKIITTENSIIYFINIPPGLKVDALDGIRKEINTYFQGITTIKKNKFENYCTVKIVTKDISDFEFKPVKCVEYEIYIGKTLDLEDYKVDLTKSAAHVLIAAPSGKGKSFVLASILTNLIYNSADKIELYLLQIMKGDVSNFEKCKPVKFTAYTLEEVVWGLEKLVDIINKRDRKFRDVGINNLKNYNKHYPKARLKRIFAVAEEISFFMSNDIDDENNKQLKARALEALKVIIKAGRSVGCHLITVSQRGTVDSLPSLMKSMMIRVCLGQISSIDSRNIIESDDAIYLEDKECYVYGDVPGLNLIKIPTIDEDFSILNKYVPEIKTPKSMKKKNAETKNPPAPLERNNEEKIISEEIPLEQNIYAGPKFNLIDLSKSSDNAVNKKLSAKKIINKKGIYKED